MENQLKIFKVSYHGSTGRGNFYFWAADEVEAQQKFVNLTRMNKVIGPWYDRRVVSENPCIEQIEELYVQRVYSKLKELRSEVDRLNAIVDRRPKWPPIKR